MAFSGFSAITSTPLLDTEESPYASSSSLPHSNIPSSMRAASVADCQQLSTPPAVSRFREEFDDDVVQEDVGQSHASADYEFPEPLSDQTAESLGWDGAFDVNCQAYEPGAHFGNLLRPHGIPLDTIDEVLSESSTDSIDTRSKSSSKFSQLRRRLFNRRSSSAPELGSSEEKARDFNVLFPSLARRTSSLHSPRPLSPLERSEVDTSASDARSSLTCSSSPRPSGDARRSTQSVPDLSPTKRIIARALGDIARILRGQSPSSRRTSSIATWPNHSVRLEDAQPVHASSTVSLEDAQPVHVSSTESLEDAQPVPVSSTESLEDAQPVPVSSTESLEDAASGPSIGRPYLDSAESIDPSIFPRPLTIRNRSSLDSLASVASTLELTENKPPGVDLSPPAPLFAQVSPFGSREGFEQCRYTADGVPIYNGSWPSLKATSVDNAAINQVSASPDSSVVIQSRDLYEGTPCTFGSDEDLARPPMDNFTRLRLSGGSSGTDPFFDASESFVDQQGCLQASINALTRTSRNDYSRPLPPANLSLWPEPHGSPPVVTASPHRSSARVSSHTGLLTTTSNRRSHCMDGPGTSVSANTQCKHGNKVTRRVLLAGTKRNGCTNVKRGSRCVKCDLGHLKDGMQRGLSATLSTCHRKTAARHVQEPEPLDSLEAILMQTKRRASIKRRSRVESPDPPVREWLAISSEPGSPQRSAVNLGNGKGIAYVPRHSGKTPPASVFRCPHGKKEHKCLRCSASRVGRNALVWIMVTCFCQDIAVEEDLATETRSKTAALKQAKRRSEIE